MYRDSDQNHSKEKEMQVGNLSGFLSRAYKYLRKEEKRKAKEKGKDIPN